MKGEEESDGAGHLCFTIKGGIKSSESVKTTVALAVNAPYDMSLLQWADAKFPNTAPATTDPVTADVPTVAKFVAASKMVSNTANDAWREKTKLDIKCNGAAIISTTTATTD